jgi:hypothetical protein
VRELLGILPAVVWALLAFALRPAGEVFGPLRLAAVRSALVVGAAAVLLVEWLSAAHALTTPAVVLSWSVGVLVAGGAAARRYRRDRRRRADARVPMGRRVRATWAASSPLERGAALALSVLVGAELVVALASPPNNFDSQTYHLPRIEHWVAQRGVQLFPTEIDRQVSMPPGAEYLLLHLRLLTGGDALYNLLQLCAGVGCLMLVSRIAGQLGGSPRSQLFAALLAGTAPIMALESTSTQTDLVTAFWVGCLTTLVLDGLARRIAGYDLALGGAAVGLSVLTKATGVLAAGVLVVLWAILRLRAAGPDVAAARGRAWARRFAGTLAGGAAVLACALIIAGPYLHRENTWFGSPLGPTQLRTSVATQRHDPGSVLVNALRIGYTALDTPIAPLNAAAAHGISELAHAIGVNPNDPQTTFARSHFPTVSWPPDEDSVSMPVAGTLILLGAAVVLLRPRRVLPAAKAPAARVYAGVFWVNVLLYVATIKWQPWGNRLVLYLVVLGAPLPGLWLGVVLRGRRGPAPTAAAEPVTLSAPAMAPRRWQSAATGLTALILCVSVGAALLAVGYGWPRRLIGDHSVFALTDTQARFQRRPQWQADYEWAAAGVRASGAHRIGLVQTPDAWEYPWWVLLPGRTIVSLQSVVPGLPPARPDQVDAILCDEPPSQCTAFVPSAWQIHERADMGYALPPSSPQPVHSPAARSH